MPLLQTFDRTNAWSINSRLASTCSNRSALTLICASCCCTVRFWGPSWQNFYHSQLIIQYRMISRFMFSSSAIIFTVNCQLDQSSSSTCAVLSSVHVVDGHLLRCLSSTRVLTSEKILCQRKGFTIDIVSSPKACQSLAYVTVAFSPSVTQTIMAYHHMIFCASILKTRFTITSYCVNHVLHIKALQGHASVSGDRGRTKVKCGLR